jgi:hypothetical protein
MLEQAFSMVDDSLGQSTIGSRRRRVAASGE